MTTVSRRVLIMGAAGRDFHDFNVAFRDDPDREVVAFTQTGGQNVGELASLPERSYPPELAGDRYPEGIPIRPEDDLERVVEEAGVDEVVLSYSDLSHEAVMHRASRALATGADFRLVGPDEMMLAADVPVVAVDAVRTGCGKSQAALAVTDALAERGKSPVVVREPMPYGDLAEQRVMRFESYDDLAARDVTVEEREEFEQHLERGHVVYAGVDYADVLAEAQSEADVVVWDGGNNELPFYEPDLHFVLADPLRAGHEVRYHPGETNLRLADCVVVNKENSAEESAIRTVVANAREVNPDAEILHADSVVSVDDEAAVRGARVLCVEDGPTLTHGGTDRGAAAVAAEQFGAAELVDPRDAAVGSVADVFEKYDHLGPVLPAMGYSDEQLADLEATVRRADCDVVLVGTPFDLGRVVDVEKPLVRVRYEIREHDRTLADVLDDHADALRL
ncbi:MAG: cyclic 2,3-diphosphoglycerate synthase [Halobacteriaceae archaeon]